MPSRIAGHVLDKTRRPVDQVKVLVRGKLVAHTGSDGFFSFNLPRSAARVAVTFIAEGHVSNTRIFDSRASGINTVVIWPVAYQVAFDPARDLDIQLGGSRIQIPRDGLAIGEGKKTNTEAELRFTWFDVTSPLHRAAAPGDFSERLSDGKLRRLNSYGIFDLDIASANGASLTLRRGATIGLSIVVPRSLVQRAPKRVGFFTFENVSGAWVNVSSFDFVPGTLTYNGTVTSFGGAHNLDDPQDTTCVTVQVINDWSSAPMPNMNVIAHGLQYDSYGTTDANGFTCLLVQRNATFSVEAYGSVGNSYYSTPPWLQPTLTSPNFSSGAGDCGNPSKCPFVGTVPVDLIVGIAAQITVEAAS